MSTFRPAPTTSPVPTTTAPPPAPISATHHERTSERLRELTFGVAIVGGPATFLLGAVFSPTLHDPAAQTLAKNAAADPTGNNVHLLAFVLASYLLPISAVGLARLAYPHCPWSATVGGLLAVLGWLPFSALTALDDLAAQMARSPQDTSLAPVLDRFTNDPVMNGYLIVYAIAHLVAYVVLGISLWRARAVPLWSAVALIASTPLTLGVFLLPGRPVVLGLAALALVVIGSVPPSRTTLRRAGQRP